MPVVESEGFVWDRPHENAWPQNLWKTKRNWFSSWPDRSSSNDWSHSRIFFAECLTQEKALSRTNLAFLASGMRFVFFSAKPLNVWGSGVRFKLLIS